MTDTDLLRPIERTVLRMRAQGLGDDQIAERLKRSPQHVARIAEWAEIPRTRRPSKYPSALESRILALREAGHDHEEIGRRFGRSAANIKQIEGLAHYRRALELLRSTDRTNTRS